MQALSEFLTREADSEAAADDHELAQELREASITAGMLMKYPSLLTTTHIYNYLSGGGGPHVNPVRCPPRRGARGALVSGGDSARGREARGACTVGVGHEGERTGSVGVRTPERGPLRCRSAPGASWPSIRHNVQRGLRWRKILPVQLR